MCALLVATALAVPLTQKAGAAVFAAECGPAGGPVRLTVGAVGCQRFQSAAVGGVSAFSYYVPPACAEQHRRCPVAYLTHGTGGNYQSMLGKAGGRPPWVAALTSGPPVDTTTVANPWAYSDPATWVTKPSIDMVLVAPNNMTVPGGYGPAPFTDGIWTDWNPRYAKGGDGQRYDTPPPRFESMVVDEIMPFVERHFPVGQSRDHRVLIGHSQGGLGALKFGLQHPDLFAALYALSGASIPLGHTPESAAARSMTPTGLSAPSATTYQSLPGLVPAVFPAQNPGTPVDSLVTGLRGYIVGTGDPAADEAYWRGNTTQDLAGNARAWAGTTQSLRVHLAANDTVPYDPATSDPTGVALEAFANYIQAAQRNAFDGEAVAYDFELHQGTHSQHYVQPYYRRYLERLYRDVAHWDGPGSPPPQPDRFDYRTIRTDFSVWGWRFHVERAPVEFLEVRDASCRQIALQGSGVVTVTVPAGCATGLNGSSRFTVDLGPSVPTDERSPVGSAGLYGTAKRVDLTPLRGGRP